jgi:hypothetical protein
MRSYARNQGSQVANTAIAKDIEVNEESSINDERIVSPMPVLLNYCL